MIINLFFPFSPPKVDYLSKFVHSCVFLSSNTSYCVSSDVKSWKTSILFDQAADDIHVGFDDKNAGACVDDGNDQGKQCFG